jgi:hypothetical protein
MKFPVKNKFCHPGGWGMKASTLANPNVTMPLLPAYKDRRLNWIGEIGSLVERKANSCRRNLMKE